MSKDSAKGPDVAPNLSEYELVEEFRRRAEEYNRLHMSTPEKAKATLQRTGILTKSGKLAKPYR